MISAELFDGAANESPVKMKPAALMEAAGSFQRNNWITE